MPNDHNRSGDARRGLGNWECTQSFVGGRIRRMAAAAMAMALVQTVAVAAEATGDVEVSGLSQQMLAGSQVHSVWMDLEPSRPRTYGTSWCSAGDRSADRSSGHRDGGAEGQTAETGGCDTGLGLGSAGQGEEPRPRGGAADDDSAGDGGSESEMALAEKAVNEARQLAVQDTVIFADVEVLVRAMRLHPQQQNLDPAAREALARMTGALTNMRAMQQAQQQVSTPITPMTPTVTKGTEPFQELQVTQEAVLREGMRQADYKHCSWTKPARLEDAPGRTQAPYSGGTARRTGERPWRGVVGDRRGAPEQIRPSCQRQVCPLLKRGIEKLGRGRRTQVRGELRWLKLTSEKWADRKRRWRTTPECRIGEAKKPGPPDKLKTCPMCGASAPFVKHKRRQ